MSDIELTEKMERYCQARATGYTRTDAAKIAYPDSQYPGQLGSEIEAKEHVQQRIMQLQEERREAYGLDVGEQIRRYNQLYLMALEKGQLSVAKTMLERIDAIGGFEAPKRSETTSVRKGDVFKSQEGNLEDDIKRFSGVLQKHTTKETPKEDTKGVTPAEDTKH
jgi:hypothetical protein